MFIIIIHSHMCLYSTGRKLSHVYYHWYIITLVLFNLILVYSLSVIGIITKKIEHTQKILGSSYLCHSTPCFAILTGIWSSLLGLHLKIYEDIIKFFIFKLDIRFMFMSSSSSHNIQFALFLKKLSYRITRQDMHGLDEGGNTFISCRRLFMKLGFHFTHFVCL